MKRCPECRRDYYDDTLSFCLNDGIELVYGLSPDEPTTAIHHETTPLGEAATRAQIHMTDQTAVLPTGTGEIVPKSLGFDKRLLAAPVLLALVALGGFFGYRYFKPATSEQVNSIAVLPFQNKSDDPDTDYLSDGLAESLIFRLSQLPGLKVSPASSVIGYKGKETDVNKIASELGVDAVMMGRLIKRGDNLNITVELVDVRNNKSLWGEQYERKMSDLLATQREIATTIVQKLQLKLVGDDAKGITKKYTDSNEAYQLYLKGRYYLNRRTADSINKAILQFQQAADKDPNFARAYVGLADSYLLLEDYTGAPANETCPKAKIFAERALQIDSDLAEAHNSLAYGFSQTWLWREADAEFKRSNELNPNYAPAHQWCSVHLRHTGRFAEALKEAQRAMELDPLAPINGVSMAQTYMGLGDIDAGMEQAKKIVELDPAFPKGHEELGSAYLAKKLYPEGVAEMQKAIELSGRARRSLSFWAFALALSGKRDEAMMVLKEQTGKYEKHEALAQDVAAIYAGLGDTEQAFSWLEKGFRDHCGQLPRIRWEIPYVSLRGDPRFADLLKRMGQ